MQLTCKLGTTNNHTPVELIETGLAEGEKESAFTQEHNLVSFTTSNTKVVKYSGFVYFQRSLRS